MRLSDLTQEQLDAIGREVCRREGADRLIQASTQNGACEIALHNTRKGYNEPYRKYLSAGQALAILSDLEEQDATL